MLHFTSLVDTGMRFPSFLKIMHYVIVMKHTFKKIIFFKLFITVNLCLVVKWFDSTSIIRKPTLH